MKAEIYWIPETNTGRLAIMPRPRAGDWLEDEIKAWRIAGIDTIVSLLTPEEILELELADEPHICRDHQIEFVPYPIPDRQVPISAASAIELVRSLGNQLRLSRSIAIHCRMGIGRSALIAACVLVSQGMEVLSAFEAIGKARGAPVPDADEQVQWVAQHKGQLMI
jgi:protein-tyrosine phosphatase